VPIHLKNGGQLVTIVSLVATLALFFGGCADVRYANNGIPSPEARYNTYYAPDYYPYYPWDGYFGGAYYYPE